MVSQTLGKMNFAVPGTPGIGSLDRMFGGYWKKKDRALSTESVKLSV
tara:strand:+ start:398 stop:538 length:141 start_codon:yes stop_codon:yes gene_type:complete